MTDMTNLGTNLEKNKLHWTAIRFANRPDQNRDTTLSPLRSQHTNPQRDSLLAFPKSILGFPKSILAFRKSILAFRKSILGFRKSS